MLLMGKLPGHLAKRLNLGPSSIWLQIGQCKNHSVSFNSSHVHGIYQLYNVMLALFPVLRLPELRHPFPILDKFGLQQPLHAYV